MIDKEILLNNDNVENLLDLSGNSSTNVSLIQDRSYLDKPTDEVSIDLSQQNITSIPNELITNFSNLQYLYLEGNKLVELNRELFPQLQMLSWLDVRNNNLNTVPSSIIDHPSLQVLLLEGNNIKILPVEIGSLKSLRGLQLARNPLSYPPLDVVNQGVDVTIDFLRKQWQQLQSPQHIQLISETHQRAQIKPLSKRISRTCNSAVELKVRSHKPSRPRRVVSGPSQATLSQCIRVRPLSQHHSEHEEKQSQMFNPMNYERKSVTQNQSRKNKILSSKSLPKTIVHHSEDIQPKFLRDMWIEKIRQMLMTQEAILQRRKNAAALKEWQDEAKSLQQNQSKRDSDFEINLPYDLDPRYTKMLSRKDLLSEDLSTRDSTFHQIKHEEPVNSKIMSIMATLQELQASQSTSGTSPRSEQRILAQEIKKIKEIQRSLSSLKLKNFGQLALPS